MVHEHEIDSDMGRGLWSFGAHNTLRSSSGPRGVHDRQTPVLWRRAHRKSIALPIFDTNSNHIICFRNRAFPSRTHDPRISYTLHYAIRQTYNTHDRHTMHQMNEWLMDKATKTTKRLFQTYIHDDVFCISNFVWASFLINKLRW